MENKSADLTPPEERRPEEIEREMVQTRESLTQKVAALEQTVTGTVAQVKDTVETVKEQVVGTVSSVKDTLKESVHTVADTVKEAFDFSGHVRGHPWTSVGVAAGVGFLTGLLIPGGRRYSLGATDEMSTEQMHGRVPATAHHFAGAPAAREPEKPGMFDEVLGMIGREVRQLAEMAMNSAITSLKQNISTNVPKLVDDAVAGVVPGAEPAAAGPTRTGYTARA